MGELYQLGVVFGFLAGLYSFISAYRLGHSPKSRNFERVGLFYNYVDSRFQPEKPGKSNFYVGLVLIVIIGPLGSWWFVCSTFYHAIKNQINRIKYPEDLKRIIFQLENSNLSREQVLALLSKEAEILGTYALVDTSSLITHKLILDSGDWYSDIKIDLKQRTLQLFSRTPDYAFSSYSTYLYKLEAEDVYIKLIEERDVSYRGENFTVKDNVVLESNILEKDSVMNKPEEQIAKYKQLTVWHRLNNHKIIIFVLMKNLHVIDERAVRKILRENLVRVEKGVSRVLKASASYGLEIVEDGSGYNFLLPDGASIALREEVESYFHPENLRMEGVSMHEINQYKEIRHAYMEALGERIAS